MREKVRKMALEKFHGTTTALITPFNKDGSVDYEGYKENLEEQIKYVDGLLVLGTTGETPTLTKDEQHELIRITVDISKGRIPVMVGVGTNNTKTTVENAKAAEKLGADAILVVTPYYNKPSNAGIIAHFKAVDDAVSIPIVVYNIAGRTGRNIDTETMKELAKLENVEAVKEASGNINQMMDVINEIPELTVLSGDDSMTCPLVAMGGKGVVSVVSNLFPEKVSTMVKTALKGDFDSARKLHYELLPIFKGAFIETNPLPIKTAMNEFGMNGGHFRLPMTQMSDAGKHRLMKVLERYR